MTDKMHIAKKRLYLFLAPLGILTVILLTFNACSAYKAQNNGSLMVSSAPHLLHIFNGQSVGYFTPLGAYGFGTVTNSIFSLGSANFSSGAQVAQNLNSGLFFVGTASCSSGCNRLTGFAGLTGGYEFNSLSPSQINFTSGGASAGVAVDSISGKVFVADSVNQFFYIINGQSLSFPSGVSRRFSAPTGSSAVYLAAETTKKIVAVTDNMAGSVYFFNEGDGSFVNSTPSTLSLLNGSCSSSSLVSYVAANSANHLVYVVCGNTLTLISTAGQSPTYYAGTLAASMITVSGVTTISDIEYLNARLFVTGGSVVESLSPTTGAVLQSNDLSTSGCATPAINGVASDGSDIYVSDTTNAKIYVLDATTLQFKTGNCSTSSFSTTGLPSPAKLSFF